MWSQNARPGQKQTFSRKKKYKYYRVIQNRQVQYLINHAPLPTHTLILKTLRRVVYLSITHTLLAGCLIYPLYFDGFSHTDTYNKDGIVHNIYYKGSQVVISNNCDSVPEDCIFHTKQQHFIWVFTVCQNTPLGVFQFTKG